VLVIMDAAAETGLQLNQAKCEIIMDDFTLISASSTFSQFIRTKKDEMLLLGAPVIKDKAQDTAIRQKIEELDRAVQRLSLLRPHDAVSLLKNSLAMPKLLYLLRTPDCSGNRLLDEFDTKLQTGLSKVLNVDLNGDQWLQASLPVRNGGLGIRSAQTLAPSAFLASAASTLTLQQSILPDSISLLEDPSVTYVETKWSSLSGSILPAREEQHVQKEWDKPVTENHQALIMSRAVHATDKARLLAAGSPHSGDWLHAPPIASVSLRLSDEAVRVAVVYRLGCKACEPHSCLCGKAVGARGLHGLSCRRSGPRHQHHHYMNDILCSAVKRAQIPAVKEPTSLLQQDGKRPDGSTLLPWARGKPMAWDVTVPDTYAESHIARQPNTELCPSHIIFVPVAVETAGTWGQSAIELVQEGDRQTHN